MSHHHLRIMERRLLEIVHQQGKSDWVIAQQELYQAEHAQVSDHQRRKASVLNGKWYAGKPSIADFMQGA